MGGGETHEGSGDGAERRGGRKGGQEMCNRQGMIHLNNVVVFPHF